MEIATFFLLSYLIANVISLASHEPVDERAPETEIHASQTEEEKPGDSAQPPEKDR